MKHYKRLKSLAKKLHNLFHRVCDGKNPKHKPEYYESTFAYFDRRFDDIDKILKEVAKQQKYLWQSLEGRGK